MRGLARSVLLIAMALGGAGTALGQSVFDFTSGTQSWNAAANWTPDGVPNAVGASVAFNSVTGPLTVNLNAAITVGSVSVTNDAATAVYTLNNNGGGLTFDATSGNATFTVNGTNPTTNNVSVSATLTLNDTLRFTNNNTAGAGTATATLTGTMTGAGGFIKDGPGRLSMTTNSKTYTGATVINQGRLRFIATGVATGTSSITVNSGGSLYLDSDSITFGFGSAVITINGDGDNGGGTGTQGALRNQGAGTVALTNAVVLASDATIHSENGSGSLELNASVSGTGGLTKTGDGRLNLNTANSYSGNTTISGGSLRLGLNGSIDSSPTITTSTGTTSSCRP